MIPLQKVIILENNPFFLHTFHDLVGMKNSQIVFGQNDESVFIEFDYFGHISKV